MSPRFAVRLAWSLWAFAVALTALSGLLLVLNLPYPNAFIPDFWFGGALIVVDVTVGAIVASRRPENPVGWLLCLSGVAVGLSSFTSQYAIYALLARPGSLPAGEAAAWVAAWILPVIIGLQLFYVLLFPTGRLPGRRWRWLAGMIVAFVLAGGILAAFSPGAYLGSLGPIRNPLGVRGLTAVYEAFGYITFPLLFAATASSVFFRLRRAVGIERQQIKWFAYAVAVFASSAIFYVITLAIDAPPWFESAVVVIQTAAGTTIPIAIGIAILRYKLYDVDVLINRTIVYATLTVALSLVYLASVGTLQYAFRALTEQGSQIVIVASTLAIAALFNPLRRRIQALVDRRFYRGKYDARQTLEAFSARLRDGTDLDGLGDDVAAVARDTVQPAHVSLWLRTPKHGEKVE